MHSGRSYHEATVLSDGKVLVTGGSGTFIPTKCELYNALTGNWTEAADMHVRRIAHTATLLTNGTVLVTGGYFDSDNSIEETVASAELYDPITNVWSLVHHMHSTRAGHTASVLPNGSILLTGGVK